MRSLLACLALFLALDASAALPGDVAPAGNPNGVLDVSDVLLALSMATGGRAVDLAADLAPSAAFGSLRRVVGNGLVDVADVILLLRLVVGLESVAGGVDVSPEEAFAAVQAARFGFDGFWSGLRDTLTLTELPPLNVPTPADCAAGGRVVVLLSLTRQTIDAEDCDNGRFLMNGRAERQGSLFDPVFESEGEFVLVHDDGRLDMSGPTTMEGGIEFAPGRTGTAIDSLLDMDSTYPAPTSFSFETDIISPEDGDWPIGLVWVAPPGGPAIQLVFNGSSFAVATAFERSETRTYTIDFETGAIELIF